MQPKLNLSENDSGSNVSETTPSDLPELQRHIPVLAELLCSEHTGGEDDDDDGDNDENGNELIDDENTTCVHSYFDKILLNHTDIMIRMKFLENYNVQQKYDYFNSKNDILPYMRKVVASWMLEVCEEQRCDEAVFPMAISILDKLLFSCNIKKEQLQLVACVCLLISSKTRQCSHFSLELLSWYTDNSVSGDAMRSWELMILSQLNWDINIITPIDFVDILLVRSLGINCHDAKETQLIRRHAITFIALCSTESRFVCLNPSLIAASAIYTALKGLHRDTIEIGQNLAANSWKTYEQLNTITHSIEGVIATEMSAIQQTTIDLPTINIKNSMSVMSTHCSLQQQQQQQQQQHQQQHQGKSISGTSSENDGHSSSNFIGQNTPTDVQDIVM